MPRDTTASIRRRKAAVAASLALVITACAGAPTTRNAGFGSGSSSFLAAGDAGASPPAPDSRANQPPALPQVVPSANSAAVDAVMPVAADAIAAPEAAVAAPEASDHRDGPAVAPASAAAEPEPDLAALEATLRQQLTGPGAVDAALELAILLGELERHADAVPVLQEARRQALDPRLSIALAGVQRDLGHRHLAKAELRAVRRAEGAGHLHPMILRDLAELEWLEGERDAAIATLGEVYSEHGQDEWVTAHAEGLKALGRDMASHDVPSRINERDMLGNLRGAPLPGTRLATLDAMMQRARRAPHSDHAAELERRLLAIAGGDESPAVRARAMQLGPATGDEVDAFCAAGLGDAAPIVRSVAAIRARELLGKGAVPLLRHALAGEVDAMTRNRLQEELALAEQLAETPKEDRR